MTKPKQISRSGKKDGPRYHHGDLRAALVAEARQVVETAGPEGLSLRGVAKAAGVSQAAPYHHFKDKQDLLAAVAVDGFRAFGQEMARHAARAETDKDDPMTGFQGLGVGYVTFALKNPALFALMHGPTFQGDGEHPAVTQARQASAAPLIAAVGACLPNATEHEKMAACAAAWSLVHGMATLCQDGRLSWMLDLEDLDAAARSITRQLDITRAIGSPATAAKRP